MHAPLSPSFSLASPRGHSLDPPEVLALFLELHRRSQHRIYLLYVMRESGILADGAGAEIYLVDDKKFEVVEQLAHDECRCTFILKDKMNWPYRMELLKKGSWRVESFQEQCVGCFGEGTDGGHDWGCGVCGGSGWGVL
ncbi:hypothetical protein [Hymenobacter jeollabukensis]|uniref:Uncharacterized protein n=1 Tax=Hymenobacter jeollabukensis TaxID=2025313 RepID=A0A5R8WMA3_9BACT|nr:hypothetical protein [Hymenobacter jeollabukensis]TLM90512.1 hypothetical protein FDY95_17505 [Hymenobacter jeollabukensis]